MSTQTAGASQTEGGTITRRVLAAAGDTGDRFALVLLSLPPFHPGLAPHLHPGHAEGCYILEGTLAITRGEQTIMLSSGAALFIPAGVTHSAWNPTAAATALLLVYTPGVGAEIADALAAGLPGKAPPYFDTS